MMKSLRMIIAIVTILLIAQSNCFAQEKANSTSLFNKKQLKAFKIRMNENITNIKNGGIRSYKGDTLLTGYSYGTFYDWDPYFENVFLSYFGESKYCFNNTRFFLRKMIESGFIPRSYPFKRFLEHFKPFLAQMSLLGSKQTNDYTWLNEVASADSSEGYGWYFVGDISYYQRLKKYLDHWFWYLDYDKNGLPVWNGAGHSGMDNHFSRAGVMNSFRYEGVDLACYLYRELKAMALFAEKLGKPGDKAEFEKQAKELADNINSTFWHEEDGFYYDRDERTGELVKVKSVAGFMPLFAGVAPKGRADVLVKRHLTNPKEFWSKYPIPGYTPTEEGYHQGVLESDLGCNWMGTTWVPTNYMIFHGLIDYGYTDVAKQLAEKTFDMVYNENKTTREYFNSEDGSGIGLDPFWGWSTLGYFMTLELEMGYNPLKIDDKPIKPIGTDLLELKF